METITIDVPSDVAIAYRNATPTEQEQITNRLTLPNNCLLRLRLTYKTESTNPL